MPIFTSSNVTGLSLDVFVAPARLLTPSKGIPQITVISCRIQMKREDASLLIIPIPIRGSGEERNRASIRSLRSGGEDGRGHSTVRNTKTLSSPRIEEITDEDEDSEKPNVFALLGEAFPGSDPYTGGSDADFDFFVAQDLRELRAVELESRVKIPGDTFQSISQHYREGYAFAVCRFERAGSYNPFWILHDRLPDGRFYIPAEHASDLTLYAWGCCERWPNNTAWETQESVFDSFDPREDISSSEVFMFGDLAENPEDIPPFGYTLLTLNKNNVGSWRLKGGYELLGDLSLMSADELTRFPECTFKLSTKENLLVQPIFYCYSCSISGSRGICTRCALQCHVSKGHQVVYSLCESSYCVCGCTTGSPLGGGLAAEHNHPSRAKSITKNAPVEEEPAIARFGKLVWSLLADPSKRKELVRNPRGAMDELGNALKGTTTAHAKKPSNNQTPTPPTRHA